VNLWVQVQASVLARPMSAVQSWSRRGFSEAGSESDSSLGHWSAQRSSGSGSAAPGWTPSARSLLGSEPVEQREELLALGGLEAATELLLVLDGDLHDFAEQPPSLLCEVQGPHATIAGAGPSYEEAALLGEEHPPDDRNSERSSHGPGEPR
jgi:hypothetical protein